MCARVGNHCFPVQNRFDRIARLGEHVGSPLQRKGNHAHFCKSDLRGSAFSDAATAAAVGSPRFERLMVRKNHSRVINSNSDISTNALSDAALACVHLTMTLSKAALKYLKFGERWCIMECEYCLEGREWH